MDAGNMSGWIVGGTLAGTLGGMVLGWATTLWGKCKGLLWRFLSLFFTTVEIKGGTVNAVLAYLLENYKMSRYYDPTYEASYEHMKSGKYGMVAFENLAGKNLTFWRRWLPLYWSVTVPQQNDKQNQQSYSWQPAPIAKTTLFYLRGTFNVRKIIEEGTKNRNALSWDVSESQKVKRFFIRCVPNPNQKERESKCAAGTGMAWYMEPNNLLVTHEAQELGRAKLGNRSALELLVFPKRVKKLINEIICWRRNRDWYIERGIPWKRGWLLYGPPGTGKTALVRAFAEDLDLPLFCYSLGELQNDDLQKCWDEMQAHTPCIALFEDFDNVFNGRENIFRDGSETEILANALAKNAEGNSSPEKKPDEPKKGNKFGRLSFDCLLNCLDGVNKADGIFVVITTNHVEKIDPAIGRPRTLSDGTKDFISTRPGRIDKAIELTYMTAEDKLELAERILCDCPGGLESIRDFVKEHPTLEETPAQFQERCAQIALAYFWVSQQQGLTENAQCDDTIAEMTKQALTVIVPQREPEKLHQVA